MTNKEALAQVDKTVDDYELVVARRPSGIEARYTLYPNIYALEGTEAEAKAAARECLRQHLAAEMEQGKRVVEPKK